MIDGEELHLIEVGHLAQLLGNADIVQAAGSGQRATGNGDELVVIHGEVTALAVAGAERGYAQHVRDELHIAAVPRPDHGTGPGEALRFLIYVGLVGGLVDLVLDQAVGPGDADRIHGGGGAGVENHRHALIQLFAVEAAGLDFNFRVLRQLGGLDPGELNPYPVIGGGAAIMQEVQFAVGG